MIIVKNHILKFILILFKELGLFDLYKLLTFSRDIGELFIYESITTTSKFFFRRTKHVWLPIKPEPPVTKFLNFKYKLLSNFIINLKFYY